MKLNSKKDSVRLVLDLMRETFGSEFAEYYDGDPEAIPVSNLPALIVTQGSDTTTEGQQGEDDVADSITVKVVLNKRDDFDGERADPLNLTETRLRRYVALLDDQGQYDARSIKGALRSSLLDGVEAIAPTIRVEYGLNPRVPGNGLADLTAEAHVTFDIEHSVYSY